MFSNPPKKTTPGAVLRHRVEERQWVGSWVEGAADGLASELRVRLLELVGDLATVACVVDHEGLARTEVMEREPGERRRLNVVGRREADVVDPVGVCRAHVERTVARFREPGSVFAGLHCSRPDAFVIGISASATFEETGPIIAIVRGSATMARVLAAPFAGLWPSGVDALESSYIFESETGSENASGGVGIVDPESDRVAHASALTPESTRERSVESDHPGAGRKPRRCAGTPCPADGDRRRDRCREQERGPCDPEQQPAPTARRAPRPARPEQQA